MFFILLPNFAYRKPARPAAALRSDAALASLNNSGVINVACCASAPPRWKSAGLWVVRGLLALAFAGAGGAKLYGVPMMVQEFEHIGLGQWFRYLTGALEVLGACLILAPSLAAFGALLLIAS